MLRHCARSVFCVLLRTAPVVDVAAIVVDRRVAEICLVGENCMKSFLTMANEARHCMSKLSAQACMSRVCKCLRVRVLAFAILCPTNTPKPNGRNASVEGPSRLTLKRAGTH